MVQTVMPFIISVCRQLLLKCHFISI
uniref:Uncharacterized protein n=1 Tax=Anguilla anguilla TaxID=7936 RepID=A0A0E9TA84_ANGAN